MKFIDLFAGIGGFRTGMEMNGHECVAFCEIDKYARQSYKAIHDTEGEEEWHDITQVTDGHIRQLIRDRGHIDCICGGFPCQSFSVAGKRGGFDDTRGTLFFEIMRIASIVRPRYLFLENVRGYSAMMEGLPSRSSSTPWMSSGMMRNGKCLILRISESHKTENGSSLSDILEEQVDERYFLSEEQVQKILKPIKEC